MFVTLPGMSLNMSETARKSVAKNPLKSKRPRFDRLARFCEQNIITDFYEPRSRRCFI